MILQRYQRALRLGIIAIAMFAFVVVGYWLRLSWAAPSEANPTVYTIAPNVVAIQLQDGYVEHAQQAPYQAQPGDRRIENKNKPHTPVWIRRDRQIIGSLVGTEETIIYGFDRVVGQTLDTARADEQLNYQVTSPDDPAYGGGRTPTAVFRKSKPYDRAQTNRGSVRWPLSHKLYLQLPQDLKIGKTYQIEFADTAIPTQRWQYQPQQQWSEAVHVSAIGFRPDDPVKVAFLSVWLGNGGGWDYRAGLPFTVVRDRNNRVVYEGQAQLSKRQDEFEDARDRNYTLADVYELRFDELNDPGRYRVCVAGVGCSSPFEIRNQVWQTAFKTSLQGFYHQRSGIALRSPYSDRDRPRPFHPDDDPIYQSNLTLMQTTMGIGPQNVFKALPRKSTNERVPDAWGGYFDAGDWDRRIQHLEATRLFLELLELFPNKFSRTTLNIPESGNSLPDLLDESLWNLDFFRRLQLSNGGIRGGVESLAHPLRGEASWQNSIKTYVYAPELWSSYLYAATAAQAATVLQNQDPELAQVYRESAIAAMEYGETHPPYVLPDRPFQIDDARNLAAAHLYRLTQDPQYHEIFLNTTVFNKPNQLPQVWGKHHQSEAAFLYVRLPQGQVDPAVQDNARAALLKDADRAVRMGERTAFKWSKDDPTQPLGWGGSLGTPKTLPLLRAHALTQRDQYLKAAIAAAQFSAGANPDNMAYTTGLGDSARADLSVRTPQNPLVIDTRVMAQAPPPGITVYGPLDPVRFKDYWAFKQLQPHVFPDVYSWPTAEAYFDVFLFPAVTEYTVMRTMAPTAYTWGYLAAR